MVELELPVSPTDSVTFDGVTVRYLTGKKGGNYYLPLFKFRSSQFIRSTIEDTIKALYWFNQFETPSACINLLTAGQTNLGPLKDEGPIARALDYLESQQK